MGERDRIFKLAVFIHIPAAADTFRKNIEIPRKLEAMSGGLEWLLLPGPGWVVAAALIEVNLTPDATENASRRNHSMPLLRPEL